MGVRISVCVGFSSLTVTKDVTATAGGSEGLVYLVLEGSVHYDRRTWGSRQGGEPS